MFDQKKNKTKKQPDFQFDKNVKFLFFYITIYTNP